jgi:hypothetical protein
MALRLKWRSELTLLRARALHRAGEPRRALSMGLANVTWLESVAGGTDGLLSALASARPVAVAEYGVAAIATLMATIRDAPLPLTSRRALVGQCRAYARAHTAADAVTYPRTAAFAAQALYLLAGERERSDAALITRLYELDVRHRPTDARAQATRPLRDLAYARYRRDDNAAQMHFHEAVESLRSFGLPRHQRVLVASGVEPRPLQS